MRVTQIALLFAIVAAPLAAAGDQPKTATAAVDQPDVIVNNIAVVRMEAASINPSDVKNVSGRMPQTTLPRIPGRDYAGVVVEGPAEWLGAPVWGTGGDVGFTRDGIIDSSFG